MAPHRVERGSTYGVRKLDKNDETCRRNDEFCIQFAGSFCRSLRAAEEADGGSSGGGGAAGDLHAEVDGIHVGLWEGLVAWHGAVRLIDRAAVAERWALNLEAAGLPPLRALH